MRSVLRSQRFEVLAIAPLLIFMGLFTLIPMLQTIALSVQAVGSNALTLEHFQKIFSRASFAQAFFNTVAIAGTSLSIELTAGLLLAVLLAQQTRATRWAQVFFVLPVAIPTVVVGAIMSFLFTTNGWVNRILLDLQLISRPLAWMNGGPLSLVMVSLADCWKVTPLVMLILLAGILAIDRDLYKAAAIDGAGPWQRFRYITLPLLMPSITVAMIIRGIDAFRIFALPLILMGQNLKVLGTYAYLEYTEYHDSHAAAAAAMILLLTICASICLYLRFAPKTGEIHE